MSVTLHRNKINSLSFLTGGEGEPFLLLHGIPGSAYAWEKVGARLAEHYRVIIPDLLGFGESDRPPGDYYMESQARAVRELLNDLGIERLYLGGHDFGGPVAITLMRLFPELHINGLVLSDTNLFTDTYIPPPLRIARLPFIGPMMFKAMAGNRARLRLMYWAATRQKTEATWEAFARHLTPSGMEFTWRIFQRSLADLKTNYQRVEDMLPRIAAPTLILWGAHDPFFAVSVAERAQRAIRGSVLEIYEHTGHFVPEERPAETVHAILNLLPNNIHPEISLSLHDSRASHPYTVFKH